MSQSISNNPADYTEIKLQDLKPGVLIQFEVFLYLPINQRFVRLLAPGEGPDQEFMQRYSKRGIHVLWVPKKDLEKYHAYLTAKPPVPRTVEAAHIIAAIQSPEITVEEKKQIIQTEAQAVVQELTEAQSLIDQEEADRKAWETVQDVLDAIGAYTSSSVKEVWNLAKLDAGLEHSVKVSTYTVIFAMAFGKIDSELIADLAMAGLLHDIGMSQVPAPVASMDWMSMDHMRKSTYATHVDSGLKLLQSIDATLPARVQAMIGQHHEKFDGSGYPKRLAGFKIDDVTQLLGMADLLDAMKDGHWDGQERTLKDSFHVLEKLEKAKIFPEFFNPDIYSTVIHWVRHSVTNEMREAAARIVGGKAQELIKKAA